MTVIARTNAQLDAWIDALDAGGEAFADALIGAPSRTTTTDVARLLLGEFETQGRGRAIQEGEFSVGRDPVQATQQRVGIGSVFPDASVVGQDDRRVNLEVDARRDRRDAHERQHLAALQQAHELHRAYLDAVRRGDTATAQRLRGFSQNPLLTTRSAFLLTDTQGRVTGMHRATYRADVSGRVRQALEDVPLRAPLDARSAAGRTRLAQLVGAGAALAGTRPVRRPAGLTQRALASVRAGASRLLGRARRRSRFDAFAGA